MLPHVGHFRTAIGAMIWGWGRHVFLAKSGRRRRQTQTAATDATDGLVRSLQESLLVSLSHVPCGVPQTTGRSGMSG